MNLYVWMGFPDAYYFVSAVVLADSLDNAITAALAEGMARESSYVSYATGDSLWSAEQVDKWMRENVRVVPVDRPFAAWGEHWS